MKKMLWAVAIIISLGFIVVYNSGSEDEKWHFHGYIIEVEEDRILLVEGVSKFAVSRMTVEQLVKSSTDAIWLSTKDIDKTYSIGDKVYVWTTGKIETSDPAMGTATKIKTSRWN